MRSLQIAVPAGCPNKCPFCCSAAHNTHRVIKRTPDNRASVYARMNYARDFCDVLMITSAGEPLTNPNYISSILEINEDIRRPFDIIELQTSGVDLNNDTLVEFQKWGLTTVALSLASLDEGRNRAIMGIPEGRRDTTINICQAIRREGLTLRLCLNMSDEFEIYNDCYEEIFIAAAELGAHQLTLKTLYANSNPKTDQEKEIADWVDRRGLCTIKVGNWVRDHGSKIRDLPGGEAVYSVNGIATVVMLDCQSQIIQPEARYFILRPDGKLYTKWDDEGSILF